MKAGKGGEGGDSPHGQDFQTPIIFHFELQQAVGRDSRSPLLKYGRRDPSPATMLPQDPEHDVPWWNSLNPGRRTDFRRAGLRPYGA